MLQYFGTRKFYSTVIIKKKKQKKTSKDANCIFGDQGRSLESK